MEKKQIFFIPEKLKVGFRKRDNTYTGKLSYIIYYDSKGVLRKENSWNSWRDPSIPDIEIENKPTSGFMLNRHVGGCKSGWNHRQSYCRVWDPRGFELEITIENLLWILEHCDCTKGKVLSGNFVYAWEGKDLVLVPEITEEYKESLEVSKKMPKKTLSPSDLIPGALYKMKSSFHWYVKEAIEDINDFVFIGKVKSQKNFGSKYESVCLFKAKEKDIFSVFNSSSVDHIVDSEYMEQKDIDEALYRFSISAFSWDFWNGKEELIKELVFNKILPIENWMKEAYQYSVCMSSSSAIDLDKSSLVIKNESETEFDYYQRTYDFREVTDTRTMYYSRQIKKTDLDTPRCRFKLDQGRLVKEKDFIDPGKINSSLIKSAWKGWRWRIDSTTGGLLDTYQVYPDLKKTESLQPKDTSGFGLFSGEKEKVYYKTKAGYIDSGYSLHYVLVYNDGLHERLGFFKLPEKENKE